MTLAKYGTGRLVYGLVVCALLAGCDKGSSSNDAASGLGAPGPTKVASCASGDHPEEALQGQVPAAARAAGFTGYNCNLAMEGQYVGTGGFVTYASFKDDHGHYCAYYGDKNGVNVLDITDPTKPVLTTSLTTPAMPTAGETLRVNVARQLMVGIAREKYPSKDHPELQPSEVDVYDLSADCRDPKVQFSGVLNPGDNGGIAAPKPIMGHDTNFSPDGLTFYDGSNFTGTYTAIDLTDPTKPKIVAQMDMSKSPLALAAKRGGIPHGLSISDDGNRGYFASIGLPTPNDLKDPNYKSGNGFYVIDTSEIQARKPDPQTKVISSMAFRNSSSAQHTLTVKIGGKPYLVFVTEGGSGGIPGPGGGATPQEACDAGLTPFPMGRIIDMSDEANPKLVSTLGLETHDLRNCGKVMPDTVGGGVFTYGSHICSVDNRENATALACTYFESGIRVFDIRDPAKPKEIAYFNPSPVIEEPTPSPGALGIGPSQLRKVDSCSAPAGFDYDRKLLTTACQRSGALVLKFENGVWPFKESTPGPRTVSYN